MLNLGDLVFSTQYDTAGIHRAWWFPDSRRVVVASPSSVYIFDVITQSLVRSFPKPSGLDQIDCHFLSADGSLLATGYAYSASSTKAVTVWNTDSGAEIYSLAVESVELKSIYGIAISPDNRYLVVWPEESQAQLWDMHENTLVRILPTSTDPYWWGRNGLLFRTSTELIAQGTYYINVIDISTGTRRLSRYSPATLYHASLNRLGTHVGSGSTSTQVISLWNIINDTLINIATDRGPTAVALNLDATAVASGDDNGVIKFWDVNTKNVIFQSSELTGAVLGMELSPDGRFLAISRSNGSLQVLYVKPLNNLLVQTLPATNITKNSMTLNGKLLRMGRNSQVRCYFEYTTDATFTTNISRTQEVILTSPGEFQLSISRLSFGTRYYFRAVAEGLGMV